MRGRLAERIKTLEGALRAVLRDASLSPDGDTYIRVTDTDYRKAGAALCDEERSGSPPQGDK